MDKSKFRNVVVLIYMILVIASLLFIYLNQGKLSAIFAVILTFPSSFIFTELMYRLTVWLGHEINISSSMNIILLASFAVANAIVAAWVIDKISKK